MNTNNARKERSLRQWNLILHRDIGYFLSGLIIIYCISGLALNHVDDWNPDFIIEKRTIAIPESMEQGTMTEQTIDSLGRLIGELQYSLYDTPTATQTKIYYNNATLQVDWELRKGMYERIVRRPVIFETNILHRNSVKGWRWAADVFSVLLIAVNITGLFIARGRKGFLGRGKWFVLAGMLPPVAAVLIFHFIQQ